MELIQNREPVKGDKILLFCSITDSWQIVTLITNAISRFRKHGWFYNYEFTDGSKAGNYLHPKEPYWGIISEDQAKNLVLDNIAPTLNTNADMINQTDGAFTPDSLTPENSAQESILNNEQEEEPELEHDIESDLYIDENLSDQDSIFGDTASEFKLYNLIQDIYPHEEVENIMDEESHKNVTNLEKRNNLKLICEKYNLESSKSRWSNYPILGYQEPIIQGKVYRIPEIVIHETRMSKSTPNIREDPTNPENNADSSRWGRGLAFFRSLVERLYKFRRSNN